MPRIAPIALFLVPLLGCQMRQLRPFTYRTDIGIALSTPAGTCVDMPNGSLDTGQRIRLVSTSTPQRVSEAAVIGRVDRPCAPAAPSEPGVAHYQLRVLRDSLETGVPAFAIANFNGVLTVGDDGVTADLEGDGSVERFRVCTSSEGVHLTVWTGAPPQGTRRWHRYFYLGYDVEPTCSEPETRAE